MASKVQLTSIRPFFRIKPPENARVSSDTVSMAVPWARALTLAATLFRKLATAPSPRGSSGAASLASSSLARDTASSRSRGEKITSSFPVEEARTSMAASSSTYCSLGSVQSFSSARW